MRLQDSTSWRSADIALQAAVGHLSGISFRISVILIAIIAVIAVHNYWWKRRNLPPGPTPLPLIGNLLPVLANPAGEDAYLEWAKRYGPVFTVWLGELPVVTVADFQLIMENFHRDGEAFTGRLNYPEIDKLLKGGTYGIIQTEGERWSEQRRFALRAFRNFGVGRNLMQEKILTEIEVRFGELDKRIATGGEVEIIPFFDLAIGSIIHHLLFGCRFNEENISEFWEIRQLSHDVTRRYARFEQLLMNRMPWLIHFPVFREHFNEMRKIHNRLHDYYIRQISKHKSELDMDAPSVDYVEEFLKERKRRRRAGDTDHYFTINQLIYMCFDLWIGGQETTATTLSWCVTYILHNPHVQERLHKELDSVIGDTQRLVTLSDKPVLHYVNAVVAESHRIANMVTMMNVLRRTTRDVNIGGYALPRGTCVLPQVCAVLYNEKYFADPKEFKPERFLDDSGHFQKRDEAIHFSVGKRQCMGKSLALTEMFLFTANFFKHYKVAAGAEMPSLQRTFGLTVPCPPFRCQVVRRHIS